MGECGRLCSARSVFAAEMISDAEQCPELISRASHVGYSSIEAHFVSYIPPLRIEVKTATILQIGSGGSMTGNLLYPRVSVRKQ